jgi:hypothetical protein
MGGTGHGNPENALIGLTAGGNSLNLGIKPLVEAFIGGGLLKTCMEFCLTFIMGDTLEIVGFDGGMGGGGNNNKDFSELAFDSVLEQDI